MTWIYMATYPRDDCFIFLHSLPQNEALVIIVLHQKPWSRRSTKRSTVSSNQTHFSLAETGLPVALIAPGLPQTPITKGSFLIDEIINPNIPLKVGSSARIISI